MNIFIYNDEALLPSPIRLAIYRQPGLDPEHKLGRSFFEESDQCKGKYLNVLVLGSPQENSQSE